MYSLNSNESFCFYKKKLPEGIEQYFFYIVKGSLYIEAYLFPCVFLASMFSYSISVSIADTLHQQCVLEINSSFKFEYIMFWIFT
jgi:hypothetical protein